ncbi:alpha/beta-hydrolase family protein [Luteipulveratus mongoliensis]|uniref:Alpha/beta-hydrolase catalytic domain-containing protein n=1 Tax=Luteipulveratus mongoliensis TaxID=571913 RepID=A0A0K1JIU5_9MICO|nr:alpha/beta-hydrolase family protein [Luteipulveratus mongoliensis]AKU16626.1 hypothetical protein VV02_13400 [Luteipulveratus mongoliensis]
MSAIESPPVAAAPLIRRWSQSLRLARASSAVTVALTTFLSFFPGYLPHSPLVQGLVTAVFVLGSLSVVRRLRRAEPRVTGRRQQHVVVGSGVALAAAVVWAHLSQNAMRAQIGMAPLGLADWAGMAATIGSVVLLGRGVRLAWRKRARLWRPVLALAVATSVMVPMTPSHAAGGQGTSEGQVLMDPSPVGAVRTYAAMTGRESVTARAQRAADQLVRAGGLHRSRVVLVIPTGSGWVDPNLVDGLEHRFGADVAMVGMQYSSSPSWMAYVFDQDGATRGARALFDAVSARIQSLPANQRPDLHVYGESLGATAGQAIFTGPGGRARTHQVCSALWVGTPGGDTTGLLKESSVANDDDPIVHTNPSMLFEPPDNGRPWLPVVSLMQAGVDFVSSLAVPTGAGHRYGPEQANALQTC